MSHWPRHCHTLCSVPFMKDSSSLAPTAHLPDHMLREGGDYSVFLEHGTPLDTGSGVRVNNTEVLLSRNLCCILRLKLSFYYTFLTVKVTCAHYKKWLENTGKEN